MSPDSSAAAASAGRSQLRPDAAQPLARWTLAVLLVLHIAASWWLVLQGWRHPIANWDIIPYAALVNAPAASDAASLSRRAYADVRDHVGERDFAPLVQDSGPDRAYRIAVHRDPAALVDNLRFYSVKPLYIALSRLALPLTRGNGAAAAGLVSAVALGLVLTMLPFSFRAGTTRLGAVALLWLLLLTGDPPIAMAAKVATPDTLGMLFVTACAFWGAARRAWPVTGVLALLAVLARPDAAFIVVPLLGGLAYFEFRADRRDAALGLVACMLAVFVVFVFLGRQALPWSTLFWHTFVTREAFPSTISHKVTFGEYVAVLARTLPHAAGWRPVLFLVAGAAIAFVPWLRRREVSASQWLALTACGGMVLHYLVFPIDEYGHERMFLASYALILGAGLLRLDARAANAAQSSAASPAM